MKWGKRAKYYEETARTRADDVLAFDHPFAPPAAEQHDVPWRDFQQATKFGVVAGLAAAAFYLTFVFNRDTRMSRFSGSAP
ncbi:MAG: hypothetical protein R2706_01580 [Acidimicrobiales bacterium]